MLSSKYQEAIFTSINFTFFSFSDYSSIIYNALLNVPLYEQIDNIDITKDIYINYSTSQYWDGNLHEISHIGSIGNILYTDYLLWLVLSSIFPSQ